MDNILKPPQAIIYTFDMEPITCIDMRAWYWEFLHRHKQITIPILFPLTPKTVKLNDVITEISSPYVTIFANEMRRKQDKSIFCILTTGEEENALLLKSAFLPGQQPALIEERKKAFAKGFLEALDRMFPE